MMNDMREMLNRKDCVDFNWDVFTDDQFYDLVPVVYVKDSLLEVSEFIIGKREEKERLRCRLKNNKWGVQYIDLSLSGTDPMGQQILFLKKVS